jgi:integrase
MKAMILLGVNCGFGNQDVATLPFKALDLKAGWLRFPRPKTGITRRCPLWPETVVAIKEALASRPRHKSEEHSGLAFITVQRNPWSKSAVSQPDPNTCAIVLTNNGPVTQEFNKLLNLLDLKTPGICFYALRHTFATIGAGRLDQIAVNAIMGHVDESIPAHYRETIDDSRLQAVVSHIRAWLFPEVAQ